MPADQAAPEGQAVPAYDTVFDYAQPNDYEQYDGDDILISDKTETKVNILGFKLY